MTGQPKTSIPSQAHFPQTGPVEVSRTPLYFGSTVDSLFGWYHAPQSMPATQTAILICPPIGYEYVHSHRSLRHLADQLASSGLPVLRFDYHGTGDSGGLNQDPDRVSVWLDNIRQAIVTLRELSGCEEVGLLGLRMGASFAAMIAAEMDIGPLVLWEPCIQGRRFVRELKALHLTASSQPDVSSQDSGDIESAGFVITAQTAEDLSKIKLKDLVPRANRILICQRDDAPEDNSLREAWASHADSVELMRYTGYADLMAEPHFTRVPQQAIADMHAWLCSESVARASSNVEESRPPTVRQQAEISYREYLQSENNFAEQQLFEEYIMRFGENDALFGIVSQPASKTWQQRPTIILLNSGAVHHVGPHRLYIFLARQFTQMGFRCLRLDMTGIGDSIIADSSMENHPYTSTSTRDTAAAIVALKRTQPEADFLLMGLCSGAHASFHAALDIIGERISGCVLINPLTFYWKEGMTLATPSEAHYRQWTDYSQSMRRPDKWLKLLKGKVSIVSFKEVFATLLERARILIALKWKSLKKRLLFNRSLKESKGELSDDLQKIVGLGRHISFIFSVHDPGYDLLMTNAGQEVKKLTRQQQLSIDMISNADHTFTRSAARQVVISRLSDLLMELYGRDS